MDKEKRSPKLQVMRRIALFVTRQADKAWSAYCAQKEEKTKNSSRVEAGMLNIV
jgi:hypothetical protein